MISGALRAVASARISSNLPRPTRVAGSAASRTCCTVPATSAPALRASSTSSAKDSRPCSPAGNPGMRGARFQVTPTNKARSAFAVACCVFMRGDKRYSSGRWNHRLRAEYRRLRKGLRHEKYYTPVACIPRLRSRPWSFSQSKASCCVAGSSPNPVSQWTPCSLRNQVSWRLA